MPAAPPGAPIGAPATLVLSPKEVILPGLQGGPQQGGPQGRISGSAASGGGTPLAQLHQQMPTARLPNEAVKALISAPAVVTAAFAWGTVKPPPPIDMLEDLAKRIDEYEESRRSESRKPEAASAASDGASGGTGVGPTVASGPGISPSSFAGVSQQQLQRDEGAVLDEFHFYDELVTLWRAIAVAHREKRLSQSDIHRVVNLCIESSGRRKLIPTFYGKSLPFCRIVAFAVKGELSHAAPITSTFVRAQSSIAADSSTASASAGFSAKSDALLKLDLSPLAARAFVGCGYLFNLYGEGEGGGGDLHDGRGSGSGMPDRSYNAKWVLRDEAASLIQLLSPPAGITHQHARDLLVWCSSPGPRAPRMTHALRAAYSLALWAVTMPTGVAERGQTSIRLSSSVEDWAAGAPLPAAIAKAKAAVAQRLPRLRVYCCSGPGNSSRAFPPRWINCFKSDSLAGSGTITSGPTGSPASSLTQIAVRSGTAPLATPVYFDDFADEGSSSNRDTGNTLSCAALIRPEHGLQPIGVLNHKSSRGVMGVAEAVGYGDGGGRDGGVGFLRSVEELEALSCLDGVLLQVLGIDRTSDSEKFRVSVSAEGAPCPASRESSLRLQIVLLLLATLASPRSLATAEQQPQYIYHNHKQQQQTKAADGSQGGSFAEVEFVKFEALNIQLQLPSSESPELIPIYATREVNIIKQAQAHQVQLQRGAVARIGGGAEKGRRLCVAVAGDPDDYADELGAAAIAIVQGSASAAGLTNSMQEVTLLYKMRIKNFCKIRISMTFNNYHFRRCLLVN